MDKQSKSVRILDIIALSDGMRLKDVQEALWKMTHPDEPFTRDLRGYWCTNLLGGGYYHPGILKFFCTKGVDGKWRRNDKDHCGHPWKTMGGWYKFPRY